MDFSIVCRTCLSDSNLNPIFQDPEEITQYSAAIFAAAGIKVEPNDGLPQQMCSNCLHSFNKYLQFRKRCKEVETQLIKYKTLQVNSEETKKDTIVLDNAKQKTFTVTLNNIDEKPLTYQIEVTDNILELTEDVKPFVEEYLDENIFDEKEYLDGKLLIDHKNYETEFGVKIEECENDKKGSFPQHINITEEYLQLNDSSHEQEILSNIKKKNLLDNSGFTTKIDYKIDIKKELREDIVTEAALTYLLPSGRMKCRLCSKVVAAASVDYHMARSHPQADTTIIKCNLCNRYVKKSSLARHNMKAHGDNNLSICYYCKEEFKNGHSIADHICSVKCERKKVMVDCDVCHKTMQKASLRLHKAVKHAGHKPVCEYCGRSFGNNYRLKEHYRSKHGYDKLKCDQCPFQSSTALAMQNHARRHLGEKPFVCECGAKYHAAYLLAQHRQTHGDKLFKCDQCPKTFKVNNNLHLHKATCHSKTQVKCHICYKSYSNRHYAVKHLRYTHGYFGKVPKLQKVDDVTDTMEIEPENCKITNFL